MGAEENRKLVQGAYEAFQREEMESVFAAFAEDVVWINHEDNPFAGTFHGHDGMMQSFATLEKIDLTKFDVRTIMADDDGAIAVVDIGYTVKATGKSTEGPTVHITTIKDGKITRFEEVAAADGGAWR